MSDVYIMGVDMIKFGRFPEKTVPELGAEAALMALDDAGLTIQDMQAMYCGNLGQANGMVGQRVLQQIGQTGIGVVNCANACATGATAFREAWMSIKAGVNDVVLAVGVEQMGKGLLGGGGGGAGIPKEGLLGSGTMPAVFAEAGMEHARNHGTTFEQFNTKLMCSVNVDGAAAAVLVSEKKAKEMGMARAVKVRASILTSDPYSDRDLVMPDVNAVTRIAAKQAYEMAGVGPEDVNLVELVPVNVSGGLLSKGHPLGATGIANIYEVSTHLRGEADKRQVKDARIGMTHVIGLGSACAIHILEKVA